MAYLFCISRETSYGNTVFSYYIDDSIENNTILFSMREASGGQQYNFKLPVGIYYQGATTDYYLSVFGYSPNNSTVVEYEGSSIHYHTDTQKAVGRSFGVDKPLTFGTAIPFFNNIIDASNYSMGLEYDASNWIGGKPLAPPVVPVTSNGGGATHIAKVTGQLKNLSSNLSDILMVSGGGGGGLLSGDTDYSGKEAGGISGSGDNSADQSTGNAFGLGESGTNVSGGGSGLYGGYKGTSSKSGGAGSGYIGNSLLSNKKMVGYNVPTSSAEGTKTESVNVFSASGEANKPKAGNGMARIKFLRDFEPPEEYRQYLDKINGSGFWWKDYPNKNYYNANKLGMDSNSYPPSSVSWISNYDDYSYNFTPTASREQYCTVCDIQNVYITSNNDVYSVSHTISNSRNAFLFNDSPGYNGLVYTNQRFTQHSIGTNPDGTIMSYSGTLANVLTWMTYRFRNINVYVDGILWSSALTQ